MARVSGFNREQVGRFYELLKGEIESKHFGPSQIFNIDESGLTTVLKPGKILAGKGCKQVGKAVSGEKGSTTTVVCAMSASGVYVPPPMFLFKRKKMNARLMNLSPPGSTGVPSATGWMDTDLFLRYMKHFISLSQSYSKN